VWRYSRLSCGCVVVIVCWCCYCFVALVVCLLLLLQQVEVATHGGFCLVMFFESRVFISEIQCLYFAILHLLIFSMLKALHGDCLDLLSTVISLVYHLELRTLACHPPVGGVTFLENLLVLLCVLV
jgi:hypothetical protein